MCCLLLQIGNKFNNQRAHRGCITSWTTSSSQSGCSFQASTLLTRKLWNAYSQAIEISKSSVGCKRSRIWLSLRKILQYIPADHLEDGTATLDQPASHDSALKIAKIFENLLEAEERRNRYNRIINWKRKLRSATKRSYKWLKNKSKHVPVNITVAEQGTTTNTHARLDSRSKVWKNLPAAQKRWTIIAQLSFKIWFQHESCWRRFVRHQREWCF